MDEHAMTMEPSDSMITMLSESLLPQITRTYYALVPAFEQHMGVSRARWHILTMLLRGGEKSQADLAQSLDVDGAAVTRQVKQLEEEGLVTRRAAPHDNRFTLVMLTPAGQQFIEERRSRREAFEALATNGLSDDAIAVTRRCLEHMRENLEAL
ncbi:MAG TPA: MarR family transcriptional regulator [Roseiflexaceae bacterium]|jgi:DNA-binding MarR family transcriptional regulator|nr:MarR family transcriptional regulator [Roseiflexaceae bacterium]